MTPHIFIQARLGSKRLPGKVLFKILGKTVIEHIVERMQRVEGAQRIILVTGPEEKNFLLVQEAKRLGIAYFCGSEENLLDRFYQASLVFRSEVIVRVTGDNPLIDPGFISKAIPVFLKESCDILVMPGLPYGMGFEIFSQEALQKVWQAAKEKHGKDFDTVFINPVASLLQDKEFRRKDMFYEKDLTNIRLTVDYQEDFDRAKEMYEALYRANPNFGLHEILGFLGKR
ncbi:MAG: NTP transferase domain-containing protein [Patescibacteria group bacterium]